jgi:hypothetical protein
MNSTPLSEPKLAFPPISRRASLRVALCILLGGCLLSGCKSVIFNHDAVVGPLYKPSNVYRASVTMPPTVRRVALLPLVCDGSEATIEEGRAALQDVLVAELNKTKAFEVIPLSAVQLVSLTGKNRWGSDEVLPQGLIKTIKESVACDAILFPKLTQFRPYLPIAIGWNLKLVECKDGRILWSTDETFDSGDGAVANAARQYYHDHLNQPEPLSDSRSILSSPRRFGQYTLQSLFSTLPAR